MINLSVKSNIGGLGLNSASLLRKIQMEKVGSFALQTVIARAKRGIGSSDVSMPPLAKGYAKAKIRRGLGSSRNLVGFGISGHMLDNPTVRKVSETAVSMSFTSRSARAKALANELRASFWQFSDSDQAKIIDYFSRLLGANVVEIQRALGKAA